MSRATFKTWKAIDGRFHWRLVSPNGKTVCSGQPRGYVTLQSAIKGIRAVKKTAPSAKTKKLKVGDGEM